MVSINQGDSIGILETDSNRLLVFPSYCMSPGRVIILVNISILMVVNSGTITSVGSQEGLQGNFSTAKFPLPFLNYAWPAPLPGPAILISELGVALVSFTESLGVTLFCPLV